MAIEVRPSPFNFKEYQKYMDVFRRSKAGTEYDEHGLAKTSGFRKMPRSVRQKNLVTSLGYGHETPDGNIDLDKYMKFLRQENGGVREDFNGKYKDIQSLGEYVQFVFSKSTSPWYSVKCPEGSHILQLDYSPNYMMLRAYFQKHDNIVVYFYVPMSIYATLEALADSPSTRLDIHGVPRHLVGIYFWNLIRIRGTVTGSRYLFTYEHEGKGTRYRTIPGEREAEGSPDSRDIVSRIRSEAATEQALGNKERASRLNEAARMVEDDIEKAKQKKREEEKEPSGKLSDAGVKRKMSRLDPVSQANYESLLDKWGTAPIEALGNKKSRSVNELEQLGMLIAKMNKVAMSQALSGSMKEEFEKAGKARKGDRDVDPYIRQERYLIEKNLWPRY